jgi:hypothetical protein
MVAAALPLVIWLLRQPFLLLAGLGASLPALMSVTGHAAGSQLAVSDILLLLLFGAIALEALADGPTGSAVALRPVAAAVMPYGILVLLLWTFHAGVRDAAQSVQRYELFAFPLIIGAYAALRGKENRVLSGYVVASTGLVLIWPFAHFGLQKNPVGQIFANAILLVVAASSLRRLTPCLVVLVPGLLYTESRGAIGAALIGVAVIVVFRGAGLRSVRGILPAALIAVAAFLLAPASLRARVTTLTAGTNTPAAYSLHIRQRLSADAKSIIAHNPWTGVGIGNYGQADAASSQPTDDPHQVLLLQAAEGGYPLAALFTVLVVGSAIVLYWRMRSAPLAAAAAAILVGTAMHGLVDVYWVRGTPVLGWLLVGMTCGAFAKSKRANDDGN